MMTEPEIYIDAAVMRELRICGDKFEDLVHSMSEKLVREECGTVIKSRHIATVTAALAAAMAQMWEQVAGGGT